jgi:hypothetical protein
MSRYWRGPELTTTPGSDFSNLCGILYEIVSGVQGEGLTGAISRFARSAERKDADQNDLDYGPKYEETVESDNFYAAKERIKIAIKEYDNYKHILGSSGLSEGSKFLIGLAMEKAAEEAIEAANAYGPNLVWASQLGPDYLDRAQQEHKEFEATRRKLNIEIGQIRRKNQRGGST